jgi:hypothetical protein
LRVKKPYCRHSASEKAKKLGKIGKTWEEFSERGKNTAKIRAYGTELVGGRKKVGGNDFLAHSSAFQRAPTRLNSQNPEKKPKIREKLKIGQKKP